jgi:hypothetical protein
LSHAVPAGRESGRMDAAKGQGPLAILDAVIINE